MGLEFSKVTCLLNGKLALRLWFFKVGQYGEDDLLRFLIEIIFLLILVIILVITKQIPSKHFVADIV